MTTMPAPQGVLAAAADPVLSARPQARWRDDMVTIVLGLWLIIGVFVDGYAHTNLRSTIENFFTPWHALLYSGFTATALWSTWLVVQNLRLGRRGLAAIPAGYGQGMLGATIFGLGGMTDLVWHTVFGIEAGLNALLSPTHLLLLLGGVLVVTSPLRSAWTHLRARPGFIEFLPVLLSALAALSFVSFMQMYMWGFTNLPDTNSYASWFGRGAPQFSVTGVLWTNTILMAVLLLLLKRWHTPFGTFALIFSLNALGMSVLGGGFSWMVGGIGLVAGLLADTFIALFKPSPSRISEWRALSLLLPLVFWGLHYLNTQLNRGGIGLERETWLGAIVMAALSGLVLGILVAPPKSPAMIEARE
jgi:hypothetical protein